MLAIVVAQAPAIGFVHLLLVFGTISRIEVVESPVRSAVYCFIEVSPGRFVAQVAMGSA